MKARRAISIAALVVVAAITTTAAARTEGEDDEPGAGSAAGAGSGAAGSAGAVEYPPQALELLPRELLDNLPRLVTKFLRAEHYQALKAACPQREVDQVVACLGTPAVQQQLGTLTTQGVLSSLLDRMDVELARRLSADDFAMLDERCAKPGEAWATCVLEHGVEAETCSEPEEALARCVVDGDDVVELYLAIADQKKRLIGKELYAELAGLLAVLPVEAIEAARRACPQTEAAAAIACLQQHEVTGAVLGVYVGLAKEVVEEAAKEATAAGASIDIAAYTDRVLALFLTLPSQTITSLARDCEQRHPELANVKSAADLDRGLACIHEAAKTDPVANPAYISRDKLRSWLDVARAKVVEVIRTKERAAQDGNFGRILLVLILLAATGSLVVLLMPLALDRRYPGQRALLWKASAVAAATFAITVALLGGALLAVRSVQGAVAADSTSPKMRVAEAAFSILQREATVEAFSELSKERLDFVKSPLRKIVAASGAEGTSDYAVFAAFLVTHWADLLDEPELKHLAKNTATLSSHAASFKSVFAFYRKIDWLMGLVPIVLSLLAVVLYLIPLKDTLVDIASAPARAARGEAAGSAGRAMRTVWAEAKSALPFVALVLVLLPVTGLFLAFAVEPLVEMLMGYSLLTLFYVLSTEASTFVLYASLGSAILLLVLCLAAYIVTMSFFLGAARKVLRETFHGDRRFADFKAFWLKGSIATVWLLALPFLYVVGVRELTELVQPEVESLGARDMLLVPLPALLLFPVVFWALRGMKALGFIKRKPAALLSEVQHEPKRAPG